METAAEIEKTGQRALAIKADLAKEEETRQVFNRVMDEWGRLDVLVNNALYMGRAFFAMFADTPWEALRQMMNINTQAGLLLVHSAVPVMIKQGGGALVYITTGIESQREDQRLPGEGATGLGYSVSKVAMDLLAPVLAKEVKQQNILVANLMPGAVMTERAEAALAKNEERKDFDFSQTHCPRVPAVALAHLISHPNRMHFSGKTIIARDYVIEHNLLTVEEMSPKF
jgi:NAD(P)-dependent dehydrogenase (short-subunit alcohol dehydrogenase family)